MKKIVSALFIILILIMYTQAMAQSDLQVLSARYDPIGGTVTAELGEAVSVGNSGHGMIIRQMGGMSVPCYAEASGSKLILYFDAPTLPRGKYRVKLTDVASISGFEFDVVYEGLVPLTKPVYTSTGFSQRFVNYSSSEKTISSMYSVVRDGRLISLTDELLTFPSSSETVISKSYPEGDTGSYFIWESTESLKPKMPAITKGRASSWADREGEYIIEYIMPFSVSASETAKKNFTLTGVSDNKPAEILNVTYFPLSEAVKILFTADKMDNAGVVLSFSSGGKSFSDVVYAKESIKSKNNGISVTEITLCSRGKPVYSPRGTDKIVVAARVENVSGEPVSNALYRAVSGLDNNILYEGYVSLPSEGSELISFCISKSNWKDGETIEIVFD